MGSETETVLIPNTAPGCNISRGASPVASTATNFFRLPIELRIIIYKLVLIVRHPIYLIPNGTRVHKFGPEFPRRWLALLHTSRHIHNEASVVAYGSNKFTLVNMTEQADLLQAFLDGIGSANASFLSHITVGFPAVEAVGPGKAKLSDASLRVFELLGERCTCLTTLEIQVYQTRSAALRKADDGSSLVVDDAVSQIDARLGAVPSLSRVTAVFYDRTVDISLMALMKRRGWVVHIYGN